MKVGLVFDNQLRPETTGYYCRRALGKLVDVEHLLPGELDRIEPSIFELFLFIDDGLDYPIPPHCRPYAAWAIDTHIALDRSIRRFGDADFLFAAQQNGAASLQHSTGRTVHWLPLACDPEIHRPISGELESYDVGFVGHVVGNERERLLKLLAQRYPGSWFGQAFFDEMCRIYSRSRVGFNCSVADDINMRLFEILACGIPLITNSIEHNGLEDLFDIGDHLWTFRSDEELFSGVDRLLKDRPLARKLAAAGQDHVLKNHTYQHRMSSLLGKVASRATSIAMGGKSKDYFEFNRPDVRALIPTTAQRILDIGCASGALGSILKTEQCCHITGIEADAGAACVARARLDHVIEASIESLSDSTFEPRTFDCIVLADVLEHLRTPLEVLRKCRRWLADHGSLVLSVPNSRHHSVVSGLLDGNWTYERAGLLDNEHVRCFTRRELEKLLYRAGFEVQERVAIPGSGYSEWKESADSGTVRVGKLSLSGLTARDAEEFFIYQLLVRVQPRPPRSYGRTSIIIATFNQLWATRQCVDSLLIRTDGDIELIFVDNGSTDGTPEYLHSVPAATVIRNETNRGFAPAVNQGLKVASGQQILLLNNDCVVTTGWLEGLLEALYDHPSNGLIGPVSNSVSGDQQIPVSYSDLSSLDGFAWDQRSNRALTETNRLVGFCLLFRRELMDRIGLLDERFEIGCFEDDDYCRRAAAAGYRALIAHHVFVHHFGSATFRGSGVDFAAIMTRNEQRYRDKWDSGSTKLDAENTAASRFSVSADFDERYSILPVTGGRQLLQRKHIRLSLCMIVRDNEETIQACLESIYPWVDEIIIVDTGSKDRTPDICRTFGARLFEFPWCDDFSAARNESLKPARGDWIFWMDSDDVMDQVQGRKLRELVYGSHDPACFGYVVQVHCESSEPGQMTTVDHVKIFRNLPELRFEHRIHEQILPAIRRAGGTVAFTDLFVTHEGSIQTPEVRQRKLERDFRILQLDLTERPNHPFVLFNLGMTHDDAGNYADAEAVLRNCLEVSAEGESHVRKAYSILLNSIIRQGKANAALAVANTALELFPGDKELLFRRSLLHLDQQRLAEAARDMEQVVGESIDRAFQSLDLGITGHKAWHNLAVIYEQMGHFQKADTCWQTAVQLCPAFSASWIARIRLLLKTAQLTAASQLQLKMQQLRFAPSIHALVDALILESQGRPATAGEILENDWTATGNAESLDEAARIYLENGHFEKCLAVLSRLQELNPGNVAVLHNLATAFEATGRYSEAFFYLRKALALRPESEVMHQQLARLIRADGHTDGTRP